MLLERTIKPSGRPPQRDTDSGSFSAKSSRKQMQDRKTFSIGISTCPNDTFTFHALLAGKLQTDSFDLKFELGDIQDLNERCLSGSLDFAKVSFAAALKLSEYGVLRSGSALGFGVGPLLLS